MKNTRMFVSIFLGVTLLAICAALLLFAVFGGGRPASAPGESDAPAGGALSDGSAPVLNPTMLSLIGSDNAAVRETYFGRCYAQVTLRENFRLSYFTPYLAVEFAPGDDLSAGWRQEGDSDGYYDDNPLADDLTVLQIELIEEIDPKAPALLGQQYSLRQLIQTNEPITYELLCEVLGQTPELDHKNNVYYDAGYVSGDPEARSSDEQRTHRSGERVTGGHDVAVFEVDGVKLTVIFICVEDQTLTYYAKLEKAHG